MGSAGVQIVCVALGILGLIATVVTIAIPQWKTSAFIGQNIITAQVSEEGLWMQCVVQSTGQQQCKSYDSLLILSSDLQAARAMTILCGGADFTTCIENEDVKPKVTLVSAIGLILAGLLVIIPVSWAANNVVRDFNNPMVPEAQKRELGPCIYIGWASGVLLILAGGLLCCFSRPRSSGSSGAAKYYSNSASAPSKNYV
nr:Cldni protein [Danio rerio]